MTVASDAGRSEIDGRDTFDPADPQCWIAHGRSADHAEVIATAWRAFPNLPASAPAEARMARVRERVAAMRPFMDRLAEEARQACEIANFNFVASALAKGSGDPRHAGIIEARDCHGLDWDEAVQYADGHYAALAGWERRPPGRSLRGLFDQRLVDAYDLGFRAGGGRPDDLFDTAHRAYLAARPTQVLSQPCRASRPLPSQWPSPSDEPRPARWNRRLVIMGQNEIDAGFLAELHARPEGDAAKIIIVREGYEFVALRGDGHGGSLDPAAQLRALLAGCDFDDMLVAAQNSDLALIDAYAASLPLCRTMERTRNTPLQQRQHWRVWVSRGLCTGEVKAAGHIRWGKAIKGLAGKLGEFTARYDGPVKPKGHRIVMQLPDGMPAHGFRTAFGEPLEPEKIISNRAKLRPAMADMLRAFAAALPEGSVRTGRGNEHTTRVHGG